MVIPIIVNILNILNILVFIVILAFIIMIVVMKWPGSREQKNTVDIQYEQTSEKGQLANKINSELDEKIAQTANPDPYITIKALFSEIAKEESFGIAHNYQPALNSYNKHMNMLLEYQKQIAEKEKQSKLELLKNQAKEALDEVWYDGN